MDKFKIYYFLYFFITIHIISPLIGIEDDNTAETDLHPPPDSVEYIKNAKYYTDEGNIYFSGSFNDWTEELTIFFKQDSIMCSPFFKIRYCLDNAGATCDQGITLCYDSQLAQYKKFKDQRLKVMDEIHCKNPADFGIHVYTEQSADGKPEFFMIKSSLDKHFYRFKITEPLTPNYPNRCFELRMGSANSIVTTITNVEGLKLIYVGDPPEEFNPDDPHTFFDPKNRYTMNLWMLFLDFIPLYQRDAAFMPRPITLKGSKNCEMSLEFDHENINVCKQSLDYIGGCEVKYLNSSDLDCNVELQVSESLEKETGKETTQTDSKGGSNTDEKGSEVGAELGLKTELGVPLTAKTEIEARLKYASTHTWSNTETWDSSTAVSKVSSLREVQASSKTINVQVHRTDGGSVSFFQAVLQCGGRTFRYHKVTAVGDAEHQAGPQSTVVYEWREGQVQPTFYPYSSDSMKKENKEIGEHKREYEKDE